MKKRGFTLVELLVVIAIIGLLASIIIVSLNTARNRAKNSAIKAALDQLRLAAEWEYDNDEDYDDVCEEGTNEIGIIGTSDEIVRIRTSIHDNGGIARVCYDDIKDGEWRWCARVYNMPAGGNWCVDYAGYSGGTANCDAINYNCP